MKTFPFLQAYLFFALFSTCSLRAETPETSNNNSSSESSVSSQGSVECAPSSSSGVTLTPFFLNIDSLEITKVIPPPPEEGSVLAADDLTIQHYAMATATPEQVNYAMGIIEDSVFDYSEVLGSYFKPEEFPVTEAFFKKVCNDITAANLAAKNSFQHARPLTWRKMTPDDKDFGYSYPSGHTTRAFVWAELLSQLFPEFKDAIFKEAEKKAWSRVILGRHYPSDVCSGQLYAHYLVQQFLDNPEFQKEWTAVQAEVASVSVIARN